MPQEVPMDSFDAKLSSVLSAAPEVPALEQNVETVIESAPAEELQPAAEPTETATPELPAELAELLEEDAEPTDKPAAAPEDAKPAEGEEPPQTPADKPNPIDLNSSRGKRIYNGYKFFRAVESELGVIPTVEEVKEYHRAHLERMAMENEFASGDPRAADNWVANWDRTSPRGMAAVASVLPQRLVADRNFDAYNALATPVLTNFANLLYDKGKESTNADYQARLFDAARIVESLVTGKFRPDDELLKQADPMLDRQRELDAKLQQIRQFEQSQAQSRQTAIVNEIDSTIDQSIASMVEQALAPLKVAYPDNGAYVKMCQKTFTEDVVGAASRSPSLDAFRQEVARAANGDPSAKQRAVALYRSIVGHAVQQLQRPFLREHIKSSKIVQDSQARHAKLQQAAPVGAPQSTNTPSGRSMAPAPAGKESLEQMMARLTGVAL
jgi:hypothetical protein